MRRVTLDLDGVGYQEAMRVIRLVMRCEHSRDVRFRDSAGCNGFHIWFRCSLDSCDACRMVFDDPGRWDLDLDRPRVTGDVLWDVKVYRKAGHMIRLEAGDWHEGVE